MPQISEKGIDFVVRHEGFVSKAYRDPVGIVTIGTGFTNRSRVAVEMLGKIKLGMTITRDQNDRVMKEAFADEYEPAVEVEMQGGKQHELDAGYSYCFNCGPGAIKSDQWVELWAKGKKSEAALRLRKSRTTAKGVTLKGLVTRRLNESLLLLNGDYGYRTPSRSTEKEKAAAEPDTQLLEYQDKLQDLGVYAGVVDGWHGPKTTAAIKAFQKNHPNLKQDGIIGRATRDAIDRAISARQASPKSGLEAGGVVGAGIIAASVAPSYWLWAAAIAGTLAIVIGAAFIWRYRDEIKHKWKGI